MVSLQNVLLEDTIDFKVPVNQGRVVKVYDGDTFTIAAFVLEKWYRFSVRINGIDSPERRGKSAEEKHAATVSGDALSALIYHKVVELRDIGHDKYGRILATVMLGDVDVAKYMLENKYAVPYDGGKKAAFSV